MKRIWITLTVLALTALGEEPEFRKDVAPIFAKHCLSCHGHDEPDGELVLERHATLLMGGASGKAITPGKSGDSLLVRMVEGKTKNIMPPGKRQKLTAVEIETIRKWIDAGAIAPKDDSPIVAKTELPKIKPKSAPKRPIYALADSKAFVAIARHGEVEIRDAQSVGMLRTLSGHKGAVNALAFSADGKLLASAAGETGVAGEIKLWNPADGKLLSTTTAHADALYAVAISPDGKTLATGSYDQKIKLFDISDPAAPNELRTLTGHNGAVYALAFRANGKVLASASGDRTLKLWDVTAGTRLDTFSQPLKEQYALAFSTDGKILFAGGADNRIRRFKLSDSAAEGTNPMQDAVFAHDGAIIRLALSPDGKTIFSSADDRTLKSWSTEKIEPKTVFEAQPDWTTGLALSPDGRALLAGRLDGSFTLYEAATGKVLKPELSALIPRGAQRGVASKIKLTGKDLFNLTEVKVSDMKIKAALLSGGSATEAHISLDIPKEIAAASAEISVVNAAGESAKLPLYLDDLPQIFESESAMNAALTQDLFAQPAVTLPASYWGEFNKPGDLDGFNIEAKKDQTLVVDVASAALKSKAAVKVALLDEKGSELPAALESARPDPLLAFTIPADGRYAVRVSEALLAGTKDHFYRLSIGELPCVTGFFPLAIPARAETEIQLRGFNLPANPAVKVKAGEPGEAALALGIPHVHTRSALKALVIDAPQILETEPNDSPAQANAISVPGGANGRLGAAGDADYFRFESPAGERWIVETSAAQRGSPADTKIEILDAKGRPIPRLQLRAVRDSYINFRGIDSVQTGCRLKNWEEMELDNYVYLQGEVVRLFRAPQGPDSDLLFYKSAGGSRRTYFDTSATTHPNEQPAYIVEPHGPSTVLSPNGLPVFKIHFENDDDAERRKGADSRVDFTAPMAGAFLVRVTDTRGAGGENFAYHLSVRDPKPDFSVSASMENLGINAGSGREFKLTADRIDGFDGEIRVEIQNPPPGIIVSSPVAIQAGHLEAFGTFFATPGAAQPTDAGNAALKLTASATLNGQTVTKDVKSPGKLKIDTAPKLWVKLEPDPQLSADVIKQHEDSNTPHEITIYAGDRAPFWLKVKRKGHEELITFAVNNLPHGVIVDDIGLSGVLLEKGLSERKIFFACERWVPETDRLCHAIENQAGKQTSRPVMLHVRRR